MEKAGTKRVRQEIQSEYDICQQQAIDYEALAKRCGDKAYQRALDAELDPEVAEQFLKVFGEPIDADLRLP